MEKNEKTLMEKYGCLARLINYFWKVKTIEEYEKEKKILKFEKDIEKVGNMMLLYPSKEDRKNSERKVPRYDY